MTSEEWKERLPLIQAFSNGETIQYYDIEEAKWVDAKEFLFTGDLSNYRIKPKNKYRPFKNGEECFNEMMNHHPFGWVQDKESGTYGLITSITDCVYIGLNELSLGWALQDYIFADGTPFGIKENI